MDEQEEDDIQDIPEAVEAEDTIQPSQHTLEVQPEETQSSSKTAPLDSPLVNTLSANAQAEETQPAGMHYYDALPAETQPAETRLEEIEPPETEPLKSQPAETHLEEVQSAEIHLEVTKPLRPLPIPPQDIQSLQTEPPQADVAVVQPEDIQLEVTRPLPPLQAPLAEAQPEDIQSLQTQPVEIRPVEVQLEVTKPLRPLQTQPAETQAAVAAPDDIPSAEARPAQLLATLPEDIQFIEIPPAEAQPAEIHALEDLPAQLLATLPEDIQFIEIPPEYTLALAAQSEEAVSADIEPLEIPPAEAQPAEIHALEDLPAQAKPVDIPLLEDQAAGVPPMEDQAVEIEPAEAQEIQPTELQSEDARADGTEPAENPLEPAEPAENLLEVSEPSQPLQMPPEDVQLAVTLPLRPRLQTLTEEAQPPQAEPAEIPPADIQSLETPSPEVPLLETLPPQSAPEDVQLAVTLPLRPRLQTLTEEAQPPQTQPAEIPPADIHPEVTQPLEAPPAEAQPMEVQPLEYWEPTSPQSYRPVLEERRVFPSIRQSSRPLDLPRRRRRRVIMLLATLAVLVVLLVPSIFAVMSALQDYSSLKALGLSGVHHLLLAKDDLTSASGSTSSSSTSCSTAVATSTTATSGSSSTGSGSISLSSLPDAQQLQSAQAELKGAQNDFKALQARMNHPDWILGAAGDIPGFHSELSTATALANSGYDVSTMGIELLAAATPLLNRLHGHSLTGGNLVTQTDITALQHATNDSLSLLANVQVQLTHINVNDLPICAAEKAEFSKLAGELPRAQHMLTQADSLIQPIGWLLGVGQPRHFLIQTLDDTELRPTGGFAGEFGIATIQNSKLLPLTLYNVDLIDYRAPSAGGFTNNWNLDNTDGKPFGRPAPAAYSWWPIANWGLRDSNLNADFPTDAKLVMGVFKAESTDPALVSQGSQQLDGIINVTPAAIAHVLNVTGPLYVGGYDVNVTGDNLESLIHYYQLDPAGLAKNLQVFPQDGNTANARKRFVQTVAHLLEQRVFNLPLKGLEAVAKQAFIDMQAHDISVYVTNPAIEKLLVDHQAAGAINTTPGLDSFTVVHTNWSAGKVNGHVKVNQVDDVTLDNKGGATHNLTIAINDYYAPNPTGDFTTYWDYVRVYVPPSAKLLSADGFGSNSNPLCVMPHCPADPYPNGELVCPDGNYNPGPRTNSRLGSDRDPPLYAPGGPIATTSDVPGRTMWAGNVMVPMGCTATITLSWYVPGVASPSSAVPAASGPYALLVQREGGTFYGLQVTLHPASKVKAEGTKTVTYNVTSNTDYTFSFGQPPQLPPSFSLP